MLKPYHIQLCRNALQGHFSDAALAEIVRANLGQDALLNLLKGQYHFDANRFAAASAYMAEQADLVIRTLGKSQSRSAWQAFGRLLHGVQDYYAHTNYAALWRERRPDTAAWPDSAIEPLDRRILDSPGLIAARVYYPIEALTIFRRLRPALARILPADSHANMNLDSPDRGPLFPLAMCAAQKRTEAEFHRLRSRIAGETGAAGLRLFLDKEPA